MPRYESTATAYRNPTHSQTNAGVLGSERARAGPNRSPPKTKKKMMKKHQLQLWTERRSFPRFPKVRLLLPESLELVSVGCKKQFVMTELERDLSVMASCGCCRTQIARRFKSTASANTCSRAESVCMRVSVCLCRVVPCRVAGRRPVVSRGGLRCQLEMVLSWQFVQYSNDKCQGPSISGSQCLRVSSQGQILLPRHFLANCRANSR